MHLFLSPLLPKSGGRLQIQDPFYPSMQVFMEFGYHMIRIGGISSKEDLNPLNEQNKNIDISEESLNQSTFTPETTILHETKKPPLNTNKKNNDLLKKLENRLNGSNFRQINELFYKKTSSEALAIFSKDKTLFQKYHDGFKSQVEKWPINPVEMVIKLLNKRSKDLIVADMGCGEAKITQNVHQKVYSFDLVASNSNVVECDISSTPLNDCTVDIVVFCLSLMGKNIDSFIKEARRIIKMKGKVIIMEVQSRFISINKFVLQVQQFGFEIIYKKKITNFFILFEFKAIKPTKLKSKQMNPIKLKPCLYKKR